MTRVVRADERFESVQPGITTRQCFSAGTHYDPDNIAFEALLGCDEHVIAPRAGFGWHGHRGVDIVTWVLSGVLRHESGDGRVRVVAPGQALLQSTGTGIRHRETNGSSRDPLRMMQMTLFGGAHDPSDRLAEPPLELDHARFAVWRAAAAVTTTRAHMFVASGAWAVEGAELGVGDSARCVLSCAVAGSGELLILQFS